MTFTDDQSIALDNMLKWSVLTPETENELLYTLDGAAGTGKTTIVREFLQRLNVKASSIAVTAPTHKAKKVIQQATDYTSQTIQKLLGLRPDVNMDDFNINKPVFNPLGEDLIQYYKYVLIDESSMLNASAFALIKKYALKYKVKIIFLGDAYQLPPVSERISKVFSNVKNKSTLTTIVRQGDNNPMSEILLMLRKDIEKGTELGIQRLKDLKECVIHDKGFRCLPLTSDIAGNTFGTELLPYYFSSEYQVNKNHIKFLTYTNDSVESWCTALRKQILKEDSKNLLNVNETLVGYNSITNKRTNELIIENSEDYTVISVEEAYSDFKIKGYYVKLENTLGRQRKVFIVNEEGMPLFKSICMEKLAIAEQRRGGYWSAFYNFKEHHLLLENTYKNDKLPKNQWGNLLCKKDLYYNYGCTVHKSQGSTYDNAAINLTNIYGNYDISERARLAYVALSRAKNLNLILINS
jgi:hypothetical protein